MRQSLEVEFESPEEDRSVLVSARLWEEVGKSMLEAVIRITNPTNVSPFISEIHVDISGGM